MINFVIDFLGDNVIIQTKDHTQIYDNAKNAAEAVYFLLQGVDNKGGEEHNRIEEWLCNQDDLDSIMRNYWLYSVYKEANESDSLFVKVFFEELHLAWFIRGGINE